MLTKTASAQFFAPAVVADAYHEQRISEALAAFGLPQLSNAVLAHAQLASGEERGARAVARGLVCEAFTDTPDAEAWYADALEKIKTAQAHDALRSAWVESARGAQTATMPSKVEEAYGLLAPKVAEEIAALIAVATKLPPGDGALDAEVNLAAKTGNELSTARSALRKLSIAAQIYLSIQGGGNSPAEIRPLLAFVELPEAAVELRTTDARTGRSVALNERELIGSRQIRAVATSARELGSDLTLVDIARGAFPGVSLAFADAATRKSRFRTAETAHTYRRADALVG